MWRRRWQVYDCCKYDAIHSQDFLGLKSLAPLYTTARKLAELVCPSEYGLTRNQRLVIGASFFFGVYWIGKQREERGGGTRMIGELASVCHGSAMPLSAHVHVACTGNDGVECACLFLLPSWLSYRLAL